ncbi:prolipoprotein diacylglyceryl transferase family protein [Lactococcus formosensis]|uniref:prolipoprotein diacylglyceryl transferase family protein n=1 Tax=Lactococcus formosensis TaxID=1281486 RepID=UPI003C6D0A12
MLSFSIILPYLIVDLKLCNRTPGLKRGEIFAFYLIWYGAVRFVVEGMRTDSLMWGAFRVSQVFSALMIIAGIAFVLIRRLKKID